MFVETQGFSVFPLYFVSIGFYKEVVNLASFNGPDVPENELPLAATYVIDKTGAVSWAFLSTDYRKRAEPSDIVEAVKKLGAG